MVGVAGPARAIGGPRTPLGYEQLTGLSSAKGLQSIPPEATYAHIICEGSGSMVRWRDDGVAPTTSVGMPLKADWFLDYSAFPPGGPLTSIQFIDAVGMSTLNISYYR